MRAIDADKLKEHIDKLPALPDGNFAGTHRNLKALINMQPTIEPERKKGKWLSFCRGKICNCSVCHKGYDNTYEFTYESIEEWNYCPNCGAKMERL